MSRPQLSHQNSKQSVAASEDYFSVDENGCSGGNDRERQPILQRYSTPPSRLHSPDDELEEKTPVTPEKSARRVGVTWDEKLVRRKPVGSSSPSSGASPVEQKSLKTQQRDLRMDPYSPSTTPGIDETPYIRFAIDQLTRDEEVRGSRHYVGGDEDEDEEEDFTTDIIVPDSGQKPMLSDRDMALQKEMQAGVPPRHPLQEVAPQRPSSSSAQPYDVFVPYDPAVPSHQHPRLDFLPGILRPFWLGSFIFICILMLTGLLFSAIWSNTHSGLWEYVNFGDNRYFVFEYLPTIFGMVILVWLFQVEIAVQRISPFMAMASHSLTSRSESAFLDLYPSQFLYPKFQHFRSGQRIIGACFFVFWLFLFTIPLLASSFNVRYYGNVGSGAWRWVAVQGVIWAVIALYILLVIALFVLSGHLWRALTGLKWDPRSLADIITLLERANVVSDYTDTETFSNAAQFRQRLWNRSDRLGYWHTSRRPQDIFYGLGEEGAPTRRYSVEQGRIREKPQPGMPTQPSISSLTDIEPQTPHAAGDFSIRADIRNPSVRRRFIPWFLSSSSITLWILIALALLLAFLVVAFVNKATLNGFLPATSATTDSAGFSSANFLYSFIPCLLGTLLYLLWLPLDYSHRRLAPFAALAAPRGSTAEKSLLLDYPFRLPVSVTLAAASNGHWKVALLSLLSLANATIPILSGGIFWAQWYPGTLQVRIAAQPAGLYALCVFLGLYALGFWALLPGRRQIMLPHDARCLAEVASWLYMSPLLVDRVFARCETKADLVARLVGSPLVEEEDGGGGRREFWSSVTGLGNWSRTNLPRHGDDVEAGPSVEKGKRLTAVPEGGAAVQRERQQGPVRTYLQHPGQKVRYGFGVYMGRDGKEHLGIDRVRRGGRDMVLFEDGNRERKSWMGF